MVDDRCIGIGLNSIQSKIAHCLLPWSRRNVNESQGIG